MRSHLTSKITFGCTGTLWLLQLVENHEDARATPLATDRVALSKNQLSIYMDIVLNLTMHCKSATVGAQSNYMRVEVLQVHECLLAFSALKPSEMCVGTYRGLRTPSSLWDLECLQTLKAVTSAVQNEPVDLHKYGWIEVTVSIPSSSSWWPPS